MPHFHIPLQSGSDEVLRLMHRRYDRALFAHKVNLIKTKMSDAFIGVDVMVGCRGERPELFDETYDFFELAACHAVACVPVFRKTGNGRAENTLCS